MPVQAAITLTIATPSADAICLSQSPGAAGNLTLNGALVSGGIATMDVARLVEITSTGDETGTNFIIYGTNFMGLPQSETVAGPDDTGVSSVLYYSTVTAIHISAASAGDITVGTNEGATSPWYPMNYNRYPVSSQICNISAGGSLTYTVQFTGDDLQITNGKINRNASLTAIPQDHSTLTAQTSSNTGILISGVCGIRIILTAWSSGSVTMNVIQSSATAG